MKKVLVLALVAAAGLFGYKAYAQTTGTTVGNPDSNNILVVEEGYAVAVPVDSNAPQPGNGARITPSDPDTRPQPGNGAKITPEPSNPDNRPQPGNGARITPEPVNPDNRPMPGNGANTMPDNGAVGVYEVQESVTY